MTYDFRYDWKNLNQRKLNKSQQIKTYETTNHTFAKKDTEFQNACKNVRLEPTARQASKWRNKKGLACNKGRN